MPPRSSSHQTSLSVSQSYAAQSSTATSALPGLSTGSRTASSRSVNTDLASFLGTGPVLDEEDGVLVVPPIRRQTYNHHCPFHFLDCTESVDLFEEWRVHVLSHFRGHAAPIEAQCPLCPRSFSHSARDRAWSIMLAHVAVEHFQFGHTLATSRPDFALIQFMYNRKILSEAQFKALYIPHSDGPSGMQLRGAPSTEPYVMAAGRRDRPRPSDARSLAPRGSSRPRQGR